MKLEILHLEPKTFHSNGKLLLSGEYLVLDGAESLAIPTKYGQTLEMEPIKEKKLVWKSLDENGLAWLEITFELHNNMLKQVGNDETSIRLVQILNSARELNPDFLDTNNGFQVTTELNFPRNWGLGSSSTLINNIAQWANVDAYTLLNKTFGGSGYDIACAQHNTPITYQLLNAIPSVSEVNFNPAFKEHLYFVYLNKKQNSRDGIAHYKANRDLSKLAITEISDITSKMISCTNLKDFGGLVLKHENIISKIIKQKTAKELLFNDFNGEVKSLGAWGGDFIMITSKTNPINYFKPKGFETIIPYTDMILNNNA